MKDIKIESRPEVQPRGPKPSCVLCPNKTDKMICKNCAVTMVIVRYPDGDTAVPKRMLPAWVLKRGPVVTMTVDDIERLKR